MRRILLTALVLLTAACSAEPIELRGIDLPAAATPDSIPEIPWSVPFSADFPAGFWAEGKHTYTIGLDCPPLETDLDTPELQFDVSRFVTLIDGIVHLRLGGLSTTTIGAIDLGSINPGQATQAIVTVIGVDRAAADQAVAQCAALFRADGAEAVRMPPGELFRP